MKNDSNNWYQIHLFKISSQDETHPMHRFLDTDKQVNSEVYKDQWQAAVGQPENFRKTVVPSLESLGVSVHPSCLSVEVQKEFL
jgi:hypothetical protein